MVGGPHAKAHVGVAVDTANASPSSSWRGSDCEGCRRLQALARRLALRGDRARRRVSLGDRERRRPEIPRGVSARDRRWRARAARRPDSAPHRGALAAPEGSHRAHDPAARAAGSAPNSGNVARGLRHVLCTDVRSLRARRERRSSTAGWAGSLGVNVSNANYGASTRSDGAVRHSSTSGGEKERAQGEASTDEGETAKAPSPKRGPGGLPPLAVSFSRRARDMSLSMLTSRCPHRPSHRRAPHDEREDSRSS